MKWGILATGKIADNFAKTIAAMKQADETVIAVGSRSTEKAQQFAAAHGIGRFYGSYEELIRDPEVDAVYVATPNHLHEENCLAALAAGRHVLCEKPLTTDARRAFRLYETAKEKNLFLMEAFWIRFLPLYEKLGKLLAEGTLGPVRHVRVEYGFTAAGARRERKFRSEFGGGALLDIGIYNLGFLHMVTGQTPAAFTTHVHLNEYGTDDYSVLQLTYPDGTTAHSLQTIGLDVPRHAQIICENGIIRLEDFQQAERMSVLPAGAKPYVVACPFDVNGYEYEIRSFSEDVRAGRSESRVFPPALSLATLQLMDDIRKEWGMTFSFEQAL